MSWIETIPYKEASGKLKKLYDRVKGPEDNVDNVLMLHSLRPHTLKGHMVLYKSVLHNQNNALPKWCLEALGVYVSHLNQCTYCVDHHAEGLRKLLNNEIRYEAIYNAIIEGRVFEYLEDPLKTAMIYAKKLTTDPSGMAPTDIEGLRNVGCNDGEILEINQVVSYFNYVNRSVLGLGVNTEGDILGLSPNDNVDTNNWSHV